MYYAAIDLMTESVFVLDLPEGLQGLPKHTGTSIKVGISVAGEDHDKKLGEVLAVYRAADLQQYKLEPKLFLIPEMLQEMRSAPPRIDIVCANNSSPTFTQNIFKPTVSTSVSI